MTPGTFSRCLGRLITCFLVFGSSRAALAKPGDLESFKNYFVSPPGISECVARTEFKTNIYYTWCAYENGNFATRSERTLKDLSKQRFTLDTEMAGADSNLLWSVRNFRSADNGGMLVIYDGATVNSTDPGFMVNATGASNACRLIASFALQNMFLGLPIADPKDLSWSGDTLRGQTVWHQPFEARIATLTNSLPETIELTMSRRVPGTNNGPSVEVIVTNTLTYRYGDRPLAPDFPFIPRVIYIEYGSDPGNMRKTEILKWKSSAEAIDARVWDCSNYLNSIIRQIKVVANNKISFQPYNDAVSGFTRVVGISIPNRYFLFVCIVTVSIFTAVLILTAKWISLRKAGKSAVNKPQ